MGHYERDINGNYIWVDDSGNRKQVTNEGTIASNAGTKEQAIARQAAAQKQSEKKKAESREYRNSTNEIGRYIVTGAHQDPVTKEVIEHEGYDPNAVNVIGMSGRDPLLGTVVDFYLGDKVLRGVGNLAVEGLAKYGWNSAKNWARGRIIGQEFNRLPVRVPITEQAAVPIYNTYTYTSPYRSITTTRGSKPYYKRRSDQEFSFRVLEDGKSNTFSAENVKDFVTSKNKIAYLDRTYDGRYAVRLSDSFNRRNLTGQKRVQFMLDHPTKSVIGPGMSPSTTFEEELNAASRKFAIKHSKDFETNLKRGIKYEANLDNSTLGYTERPLIGRGYDPEKPSVYVKQSFNDTSPNARIAVNHEAAGHASGNFNDGYIYNYLKENNIIDWDKVSPYFKDADRGEIGQFLAELPDYLGFTAYQKGKYIHPFGKRKITVEDVKNYIKFLEDSGTNVSQTIYGNIIDIKKFVKFLNEHPFVSTAFAISPAFDISSAALENNKRATH